MADVILGGSGSVKTFLKYAAVAPDLEMWISFAGITSLSANYSTANVLNASAQALMNVLKLETNADGAYNLAGVSFEQDGRKHTVKGGGAVHTNMSASTGVGTVVGNMSGPVVELTSWTTGSSPVVSNFRGVATAPTEGPFTRFGGFEVMFRTAVAPLKTGSLSLLGTLKDGTTFNVAADANGRINTTYVKGIVDYNMGVVDLFFVSPVGLPGQTTTDISFLGIPGVSNVYLTQVQLETIRYNAVAYTYLPVDAELLGIDPVRLPSDGRVPIFKPGYVVVVGRTRVTAPMAMSNGNTYNTAAERLSRVRLIGANNVTITTGYTADLEAGTVTVQNATGWANPVRIEYREQDMVQLTDVGIDGTLECNKPLSHAYPAGDSFVSSVLNGGDLIARVSHTFDLATYDPTFSTAQGTEAPTAEFNDTDFPVVVTNDGAVTERWQIRFTSQTGFVLIGENLGQIASGNTGVDFSPLNPNNGQPYFKVPYLGWGSGWAVGNCLFIATVAAGFTAWLLRTTRPSEPTGDDYSFSLLLGGGIDNPLP